MIQSLQLIYLLNYILVALIITTALNIISIILNKKTKKNSIKLLSYETGCLSTTDNLNGIDIPFFLIGILFLVLDVEIVLLFPWVLGLEKLGIIGYYKFIFLLLILALGFLYEWINNALKWLK